MAADHSHAFWLDGESGLGGLLLGDDHHGAQVDDASAVGSGASYPPGRVFTDEQAVTGTSYVLLPRRWVLDGRGLVAHGALDHVLVHLAIQVDEGLAHSAVNDGHSASVWARDGCVGGR